MRCWFITGLSSGLGRALAIAALECGDYVTGTVRNEEARGQFNSLHPTRAAACIADVTDHAAIGAAVAKAEASTGGVDILVNNAAYSFLGTLEEADWPALRAQYETNLFGPIAVIKAALPGMRARRKGLIVNVTSSAAYTTGGGVGFYSSTKMGLDGISKALAHELAPLGIKVMVAVPGAFRTELGTHRQAPEETISDYAEQNAVRREFLTQYSGQQRGDPRKAAAVILRAVESETVPLHLPLGPDAIESIKSDLAELSADLEAWEALARETDLTPAS